MSLNLVISRQHPRSLGFRTGDYAFFRWLGCSRRHAFLCWRGYQANRQEIIQRVRSSSLYEGAWA